MAGDVPLLERLAQLASVPAAEAADLVERLAMLQADPVVGPLFGVDEEGDLVVNPLVPTVLKSLQDRTDLTCYGALLEGLTGIWNAAVRAGVVARLRASGLPPDALLLRLGALSPTLGFATDKPEWAREWLADPFTQDALLVQQCVVRVLLALRTMAEARAAELTTQRSEEHTSELQSQSNLVCRLLLEKKKPCGRPMSRARSVAASARAYRLPAL